MTGGVIRPPESDEVHVWLAPLDDLPELWTANGELSPGEAARAARFRGDTDRRWYVARCRLLRRLLRRYGVEMGTADLRTGPVGKPEVDHPSRIRFNLSHCAGLVLVGFTTGHEVGVDIERVRPMADLEAFSAGVLDADERAELAALPEGDRLVATLRIWTAKEAVLKATGDGLRIEPNRFGFAGQRPGRVWRARVPLGLRHLTPWRVTHLAIDGALGAVALTRPAGRLRFETVRPEMALGPAVPRPPVPTPHLEEDT